LPGLILPLPLRFFTQVAELFPRAAVDSIEWRARGWRCDEKRYEEIDVRPFFPIRRDDKESQFGRAMYFHRSQREVLEALDAYVTAAYNRANPDQRIGGVILLSLRIPIPPLGEPGPRESWQPMADYPPEVTHHNWYVPAQSTLRERCEDSR